MIEKIAKKILEKKIEKAVNETMTMIRSVDKKSTEEDFKCQENEIRQALYDIYFKKEEKMKSWIAYKKYCNKNNLSSCSFQSLKRFLAK